jgi:hypothetical protein
MFIIFRMNMSTKFLINQILGLVLGFLLLPQI